MSLNPVPSTIDSEPPPHQMKPNPLTTQRVKDNVQIQGFRFAPYGKPNTHLYLSLRHYPLGLDLLGSRTPWLSQVDLHTIARPVTPCRASSASTADHR